MEALGRRREAKCAPCPGYCSPLRGKADLGQLLFAELCRCINDSTPLQMSAQRKEPWPLQAQGRTPEILTHRRQGFQEPGAGVEGLVTSPAYPSPPFQCS